MAMPANALPMAPVRSMRFLAIEALFDRIEMVVNAGEIQTGEVAVRL